MRLTESLIAAAVSGIVLGATGCNENAPPPATGAAPALFSRSNRRALSDRDARRVALDRIDRRARHGLPRRARGASPAFGGALGFGPSLLDRRRGSQHPRSVADAVHRRGASSYR